MIVDLGTGDGRAALAAADAEPHALVLAVDADAASMADASRRASRPAGRGGRPNLLFVVAAAEALPDELTGLADEVRILFPWGTLLRGVLGLDPAVAAGIAGLAAPHGRIAALVSIAARDRVAALPALDEPALDDLARRLRSSGLTLAGARRATTDQVRATHSSWGRRLLAGDARRPVWRLDLLPTGREDSRPDRRRRWAAV